MDKDGSHPRLLGTTKMAAETIPQAQKIGKNLELETCRRKIGIGKRTVADEN